MTYSEKLQHPQWQKMRLKIMSRDKFQCVKCDSETNTLTVHHFYYISGRQPWEYPMSSMYTLCRQCHTEGHDESYSRMTYFDSWEHSAMIEIQRQIKMQQEGEMCDEGCLYSIAKASENANLDTMEAVNLIKEAADSGIMTNGWFLLLRCQIDALEFQKASDL